MSQEQQTQKLTPEQLKAKETYEKEYDNFAKHYMGLNEWSRIELLFNLRLNVDALAQMVMDLQKKLENGEKSPEKPKRHLTPVPNS